MGRLPVDKRTVARSCLQFACTRLQLYPGCNVSYDRASRKDKPPVAYTDFMKVVVLVCCFGGGEPGQTVLHVGMKYIFCVDSYILSKKCFL